MTSQMSDGMPRLLPDEVSVSGAERTVGQSRPLESTTTIQGAVPAQMGRNRTTSGVSAPPTAATGTWTSNVVIDAGWAINETRNAFFRVSGGAWKKVFNGSDAAFLALQTLVNQARQTARPVSFREEADGLVHEIYLW